MSALKGENVVHRGENMPWFQGSPLLDHLENVHVASDRNLVDLRFPVQNVLRPNLDFRGYAGTLASGVVRVGDEVTALPSGKTSKVKTIETFDGKLDEAFAPMAVVLTLEDEIDISRGDMIVRSRNVPEVQSEFDATLAWMDDRHELDTRRQYILQHTTRTTRATIDEMTSRTSMLATASNQIRARGDSPSAAAPRGGVDRVEVSATSCPSRRRYFETSGLER